jgi:hypothetical protein
MQLPVLQWTEAGSGRRELMMTNSKKAIRGAAKKA